MNNMTSWCRNKWRIFMVILYAIGQGIIDRFDGNYVDPVCPDGLLTICGFAFACIALCIACPIALIEGPAVWFIVNILKLSIAYEYEVSGGILNLSDHIFFSLSNEFQEHLVTDVSLTEYERYIYYRYYIPILIFGRNNEYIMDNLEEINKIKELRDQYRSDCLIINLAGLK